MMLKTIQGAVLMRNCCEDDGHSTILNEHSSFPYFLDLHNFSFQYKKIKSLSFVMFLEIGNNLTFYSFNLILQLMRK